MAPPVTLQIGERRFTTTEPTLTEGSTYFASLLSGSWKAAEKDSDGSLFIDREGDIFAYILGFLRSGKYPLFYDDEKGLNHDKYTSLLFEAEYFGVDALSCWIRDRKYEKVVMIRQTGHLFWEMERLSSIDGFIKAGDRYESFPQWVTRKVYLCPRSIGAHRGRRELCGRQCHNAMGDDGPEYEEEWVLMMLRVETCKTFKMELLTAGVDEGS